jgi:hypothetical protein
MKRTLALLIVLVAGPVSSFAAPATNESGKPPLLPDAFAGWQIGAHQSSTQAAAADPIYANLLQEYGFTDFESATYTRPDRKLTIKAARFKDASGAYGAFTFYKTPQMLVEKIGDQAASDNTRVLFYRANVLVTADFDRITPMSAGELRELAGLIPLPGGSARSLPSLPQYLPRQSYVPNSAKYVVGPVGLAAVDTPVSADLVDFSTGAEVALGQYNSGEGTATLVLLSYPTPAIAGERLRAIQAAHPEDPNAQQQKPYLAKRSGPLVVVVTGAITPREARSLLAAVNYDADVTWSQSTGQGRDNVGSLLVSLMVLTGIILGLALVAGVAFGGLRILLKRLFPDMVFDRSRDVEIIELKLRG